MIESFRYIDDIIKKSHTILLSTHENPDCDGLGSEISFYYYLKKLGKECRIINCSAMSPKYSFIDPDDIIEIYQPDYDTWLQNIDLAIIFDIGSYKRLREIYPLIENCKNKVSIDHHISKDSSFFTYEYIDVTAPATGYMSWDFLNSISPSTLKEIKVANALYSAIITDTGSFRYSNTNPKTHIIASSLLKTGVNPNEIYQNIYENRTKSQIALLSYVINNTKYSVSDEVAHVTLTKDSFDACNADLLDNEGMADFLRSIEGVEVSFVITQIDKDVYKVSLRSRKKYIINDIAEKFNGGGHPLASGATVKTSNVNKLETDIIKYLKERIEDGN